MCVETKQTECWPIYPFLARPPAVTLSPYQSGYLSFLPLLLTDMGVIDKPDANPPRKVGLSCAECRRSVHFFFLVTLHFRR